MAYGCFQGAKVHFFWRKKNKNGVFGKTLFVRNIMSLK